MAKKKPTARPKISGARMKEMNMGSPPASSASTAYQFRGRTIEILPPSAHDVASPGAPLPRMLRVDGREVMYEQTDEGVYSHEMMYQRFSTPEELAEALVRQWGTHIPAPAPMSMPMPMPRAKQAARRSPRGRRRK